MHYQIVVESSAGTKKDVDSLYDAIDSIGGQVYPALVDGGEIVVAVYGSEEFASDIESKIRAMPKVTFTSCARARSTTNHK